MNRRDFLASTAAVGAFHFVPRHVVAGSGKVPPSDKVTMASIGCGTQAIREIPRLLTHDAVQLVTVADPNKDSMDYRDWSADGIMNLCRGLSGDAEWRNGQSGVPGGREVLKKAIDGFYATQRGEENFKAVTAYEDFREMLVKEDVDAVKIMTPDHLHGYACVKCMEAGKHASVHKPLANRISESKLVIETAKKTGVATYFLPWGSNRPQEMDQILKWVDGGLIGTLREVHNWSRRPVWPQYLEIPKDKPKVPRGFNWDLWLGPEKERPYHPDYTHNVFRGWYDFGGGSMCDMGHYSLWGVVKALELAPPIWAEANGAHACHLEGQVCRKIQNDWSFPLASSIRFGFAPAAGREPVEITWWDGSMRPQTPAELFEDGDEFGDEGMMFVGDKGKILADFHGSNPRLLPKRKMVAVMGPQPEVDPAERRRQRREEGGPDPFGDWIKACQGGPQATGNFLEATTISEMNNLAAVALRSRRRIEYDTKKMEITNYPEANAYLTRDYRPGWEIS
jgi:hypothetical protein